MIYMTGVTPKYNLSVYQLHLTLKEETVNISRYSKCNKTMPDDNVIQLPSLSADEAEQYIKDIARTSRRVFFAPHAKQRMVERHVTRKEVIDCLGRFRFFEEPNWSLNHGNWQMTIESQSIDAFLRIGLSLGNKTQDEDGKANYILIITVIDL